MKFECAHSLFKVVDFLVSSLKLSGLTFLAISFPFQCLICFLSPLLFLFVSCFSESGGMCAMKEVTLFSDDAKSKESAQQLGHVSQFRLGFFILLLKRGFLELL